MNPIKQYFLDITEINCILFTESGKLIRTPKKIIINEKEREYWLRLLRAKGIRRYTLNEINKNNDNELNSQTEPVLLKTVISNELVRPSKKVKKDSSDE